MTNRTTGTDRAEAFVPQMTDQMTRLAGTLSQWVQAQARPLQEIEAQVVRMLHDLGNSLLAALVPLAAPARPAPAVACACGQTARSLRMRPATVTTVLGRLTLERAVYRRAACGAHQAPLDQQVQIAAGRLSLGLQEVLALLGATQDAVAQATAVLQRVYLVQVCPKRARAAIEDLGATRAAQTQAQVHTAQQPQTSPLAAVAAPPQGYVRRDGALVHTHDGGWEEIKTGCVSTTRSRVRRQRPDTVGVQAEAQSYVAALADAETFGWQRWTEACRRGVTDQTEVGGLGDGAHGIWNLAAEHFPHAIQTVDWYYASQYVWRAAATIVGDDTSDRRVPWARQDLDALWDGRVTDVLAALEPYRASTGRGR